MSLYLRNATWIDPETFKATTTTIKVEEGPSGGMALDAHAPVECPPEDTVLDCTGRLVTPSFGCGHHHIYSALARGMPPAPKAPANFLEVLEYVWWRMDKKLDHDMIEASALVTGLYCAKNGVTFVIDHHASPFHLDGSLETIAKALDRVGLGHLLCYEISCRDGEEIKEKGLDETDAFLSSGRKGHVGLHASFTVDDDLLGRAVDLARKHKTGVHIHVAEGIEDLQDCLKKHGKRIIDRLYDWNILGPKTLLGHCIHVNPHEMDLIKATDTMVVHNPESNMGNACGCPPTMDMVHRGILTGLGTDGYTHDMIESYKVANILHKHHLCDATAAWAEVPQMLFYNNAAMANRYFKKPLGVLAEGAAADVIVMDYIAPTPMNEENINSHILFGMSGHDVVTTIANGKVLMENRQLTGVDEEALMAKIREGAATLAGRINGYL